MNGIATKVLRIQERVEYWSMPSIRIRICQPIKTSNELEETVDYNLCLRPQQKSVITFCCCYCVYDIAFTIQANMNWIRTRHPNSEYWCASHKNFGVTRRQQKWPLSGPYNRRINPHCVCARVRARGTHRERQVPRIWNDEWRLVHAFVNSSISA